MMHMECVVDEKAGSTIDGICQFGLEAPKVFCIGQRPLYKGDWCLLKVVLDEFL